MDETILLVCRKAAVLSQLDKHLSKSYSVYQANEYNAAVDCYYEYQPEIIIVEDMIEGSSGIVFADHIRGQNSSVKIVLLVHEEILDINHAKVKSGADYVIAYSADQNCLSEILNLPIFSRISYEINQEASNNIVSEGEEDFHGKYRTDGLSFIGDYKIIKKIAEGGMADIYLGMKQGISGFRKLLVIKLINRLFSNSSDFIKRFMDEAKVCAYLNHKNIVQVYDHGRSHDRLFLVMEYVEGIDLATLRNKLKEGRIPPEHVLYIAQELCYGLSYAYSACDDKGRSLRIVHRDLSPQNILLSKNGEVKIADFGVAKSTICHHQSNNRSIVGKILYMAPEQINGKASHQSDLFSIGVILYELLTGEHPYVTDKNINSPLEIINCIMQNEYRSIPTSLINCLELDNIIRKSLTKNLELRYQSANDMLSDLLSIPWGSNQKSFQSFLFFNLNSNYK